MLTARLHNFVSSRRDREREKPLHKFETYVQLIVPQIQLETVFV